MSQVIARYAVVLALALSSCASPKTMTPSADLPLNVGNGVGSQYGNYAAQADGEVTDASGERCFVFNWDRPLTAELALRVKSASCASQDHPNWMSAREISRTVIPMSDSHLRAASSDGRS